MNSREGGIHGNPEVATTHLGTLTLNDSVENLPTHNETVSYTYPREGWPSEPASEMSLANDSDQQTACRGAKSPCEGSGLYAASVSRPLCIGITKCPCELLRECASEFPASQGCQRALL